jgi:hypothetical protein
MQASKQIRLHSLTSSEYASRILFTQERSLKFYVVRDLLTTESLFYLTAIAFTFCRLFTAGRVFDLGKHDLKSRHTWQPTVVR